MAKKAKCDRTMKEIELAEGFFVASPGTGDWCFLAPGAPEKSGDYSVSVSELLSNPEEFVDWMAQLNEKTWFSPKKFFDFFERLREKNNLFGG